MSEQLSVIRLLTRAAGIDGACFNGTAKPHRRHCAGCCFRYSWYGSCAYVAIELLTIYDDSLVIARNLNVWCVVHNTPVFGAEAVICQRGRCASFARDTCSVLQHTK